MQNILPLTIKEMSGKRVNLHTHTKRCKHAVGEDREYVEKAIEAGYDVLGFSDHTPYIFDGNRISPIRMSMDELEGYVSSIESLKKEYKNDIIIYCGLETEYFPKRFEKTMEEVKKYSLDYMILGQHYFDDEVGYIHVGREWRDEEHLELYVNRVIEALNQECFLYVAHPDIINFTGAESVYVKHMSRMANELKKRNMPIEVNINGFRDGIHYPNKKFIEIGVQNGNEFIIGVDAHSPEELLDKINYVEAMKMVKKRGGNVVCNI